MSSTMALACCFSFSLQSPPDCSVTSLRSRNPYLWMFRKRKNGALVTWNTSQGPQTRQQLVAKDGIAKALSGAEGSSFEKDANLSSRRRGSKFENVSKTSSSKTSSAAQRRKPKIRKEERVERDQDDIQEYHGPPLVCCFGEALYEFIPTVRVSTKRMDPDVYSTWKGSQWRPPEFVRAPGGSPSNVAIALARLGCKSAFMGKLGNDAFGQYLLHTMDTNGVETRGVRIDPKLSTGVSHMRLNFENERVQMSCVRPSAEDAFLHTDITLDILKEACMFYFSALALSVDPMQSSILTAIELSKSYGAMVFFDLNLSLPLWKSRDETWSIIGEAWKKSNIIEVTKQELEFLLGEEEFVKRRRRSKSQYVSRSEEEMQRWPDDIHYTRDDVGRVWHDNLKLLIVTDGTLLLHYYSPIFDGSVRGTEDVLVTPFTCDRTGSGDALVAGIIKKLITQPELYENQENLEKALRFAICAGIIAQWTIGAVRGFPTESAAQNLTEQVYIPSMVQVQD